MTIKFSKVRKKWEKSPKFCLEHKALEPEFKLAQKVIEARLNAGLTQEELADLMNTSQSAVARLESGHKPNFKILERFAKAVGARLDINFTLIHS